MMKEEKKQITEEEYHNLISTIHDVDWSIFTGSDGVDTRFCDGENCIV